MSSQSHPLQGLHQEKPSIMSRNIGPIKAQQLQPASLTSKPLESLCKDFVDGFCQQGDRCTKSHDICILEDRTQSVVSPGSANAVPNYLSLSPRVIPADKRVFEEDGPGDLSRQGTRHDNDHMDIRRICILPTTDEILCLRRPYMPCKDFAQSHFLPRGYSCLVDTLFRQLRYESTECIIDACYHAAQQLAITSKEHNHDYDFSQETPRGVRYSLFRDVLFEELLFHEFKGTVVRLSFACPRTLRGRRMHSSGLFEKGMLIALLGLDEDGSSLSTTFFEVHLRQSTDAMKVRTGNDLRGKFHPLLAEFRYLIRNSVSSAFSGRPERHGCFTKSYLLRAGLITRNICTDRSPWSAVTWLLTLPSTTPKSL